MEQRIALLGCGNVGKALIGILNRKGRHLEGAYGVRMRLVYVGDPRVGAAADSQGLDPGAVLEMLDRGALPEAFRGDVSEVVKSMGATVVADATPTDLRTGEPGLSNARGALSSGAHFVTTSKGPLAVAARELEEMARERGLKFLYEGAVMSGTPLISLIRNGLAGCSISRIEGILNGTTNYMLTRMAQGLSYPEALEEAQDLGYAEAEPTADVEGFDPAVKLCILAWVAFRREIGVDQVDRTGISGLTGEQVERAARSGRSVKLVASLWTQGESIMAQVRPQELETDHPLHGIGGAVNAATIWTDHLGKVTVSGPGAGRDETAQALLTDIISIGRD